MRHPWPRGLRVLRQSQSGELPVYQAFATIRRPAATKVMGIFERQTTADRRSSGRKGTGAKLAQRFAAMVR